ncbi:serine--tRNA ligase [Candidatus Woesebacteria bacterium CG_4_9_14_3_um_filter_39_10]|uniref:Serine--tRNA ligase n=3 Tax=Candidatus Woeseibacteriota TaxID=1752722 RepID=A0A2M7XAE0_9BACT|nr:MAG: serine--tRNA ligase [Candidatus Woesebacteria bacterium CG_4_9_14_3_um_filter_39_10]
MLDVNFIRENPGKVKKGIGAKGFSSDLVNTVLELDEKRRAMIQKLEAERAEKNIISDEVAKKKTDELIERGKIVRTEIRGFEADLKSIETGLQRALYEIPNLPLDMVPVGKGEEENKEIRKWGEPRKFDFKPKDHLELGKSLGILDFETGTKVAGNKFYFLYGDGARLELALVQYVFDLLSKEGFLPVITPDLAKSRYYLGTGYLPKGEEAQTYKIEGEDLGLIATAEVTLAGKHADEIISEDKLPIKYIGYSHCFRQEAGAYGKYSKGLYRVHQFTKAEMFIYCKPEESDKFHEYILKMEEKIYQDLGLPYRVLEMCTGDLGAMAARKFDIEVWMPERNGYGEVTSASNCTDYQARNLNIKYKAKDGTKKFVHMINGSAIASSRTPLAIMENYQNEDGSITIPKVLQKWMGKEKIEIKV